MKFPMLAKPSWNGYVRLFHVSALAAAVLFCGPVYATDSIEGYFRTTLPADCWNGFTRATCHPEQGLNIKRRNARRYYVWLHTEGDFGHFCSYRAVAQIEQGSLISTQNGCRVSIKISGNIADVKAVGESCQDFCGANVYLNVDGLKRR